MKVVCKIPTRRLEKHQIYTVLEEFTSIFGHKVYVLKEASPGLFKRGFKAERFRPLDTEFAENLLKGIYKTKNLIR